MRSLLVLALVLGPPSGGSGGSAAYREGEAGSAPIRVKTVAATAQQLVSKADRAFIGLVTDVQVKPERLKDVERAVPIKSVSFKVQQVLLDRTGGISPDRPYVVRLFAQGSRPVAKGERLLWYLAPNTEDGLTQPVGIDSGHFRFTADGQSVINLKLNENLLEPEAIRGEAEVLAREVPDSRREEFRAALQKWAQAAAAERGLGNPVPVDLLIARTKQLAGQQ